MRAKTIIILILMFASVEEMYPQIFAGVRLGMNSTWLYGDDIPTEDRKAQLGPVTGIVVRTSERMLAAQVEMLYSAQGVKYTYNGFSGYTREIFRMHYLQIPAYASLLVGKGNIKGVFNLGPYLAGWLAASTKSKTNGGKYSDKYEFREDDYRFDVGFNLGIGFAVKAKQDFITTEIRLGSGVLSVNKNLEGRNFVFSLSMAYLIRG